MGFYSAGFQYAQNLPVVAGDFPFPSLQVQNLSTDAIVILTVYPIPNPWSIQDADIQALANQLREVATNGTRGIIFFA
jgi:hypothetical protein